MTDSEDIQSQKFHMSPVEDVEIRAWVVNLRSYNEGHSEGFWLKCHRDPQRMRDQIATFMGMQSIRRKEKVEEYAVHDWEGPYSPMTEHPDWDEVAAIVDAFQTRDDPNVVAAAILLEIPVESIDESFCGQFQSVEDFFFERIREQGLMLEKGHPLQHYINWEGFARDKIMNGYYDVVEVGYETNYIFQRN